MSKKNVLMILERSGANLDVSRNNNEYVLEGVFAQFGVENNNNRIYEEKEYLPHLDYLKKKISENRLLGELDHPDKFDISLSKVSHLIEEIKYDPKKRQIIGRIKLLDTPSGQIAKNLVDTGVPISISSRAAGVVKENKKVEIKRIFTYDLVADPGFSEAKLNKVNESFGLSNNDEIISIYDMGNDFSSFLESSSTAEIYKENTEKINSSKMSENKEFVSIEEMNKYSVVIKNEIEKINERLSKISEVGKDEKIAYLEEELDNLRKYTDYLAESQNKAIKYAEYLGENLGNSIAYTEHIAEKADQGIQYIEHVAEKANQGINYSEHIAEKLDRGIQYSEMIAENHDKTNKYIEYTTGKLDEAIRYGEYLAGRINETVAYAEHVAEHADNGIRYGEYLAENAASKDDFKNLTEYAEYMFESVFPSKDGKVQDIKEKKANGIISSAVTENKNIMSRYSALDNKIEAVLESVKKQKTEDKSYLSSYPFLTFLSESKRDEFLALNETEKKRVKIMLDARPSFSEEGIVKVWESALSAVEVNESWLTDMPVEFLPLWEAASPEMKDRIMRQSKVYNLETPYQIKNFWQTRGLGKPAEGTSNLNESATATAKPVEKPTALGYSTDYIEMMKNQLAKSFNR
jgi:hypothetical protein